jgi:hypothetical protein
MLPCLRVYIKSSQEVWDKAGIGNLPDRQRSEFIGNVKKKGESAFQIVVEEEFGITHERIPPRCCTWNSDVEAFHRMIEDEFYEVRSLAPLLSSKPKPIPTNSTSRSRNPKSSSPYLRRFLEAIFKQK